ncbi:MAG: hypothetical protein ACK5NQ_06535 [Pseudomonas sp.]
MYDIDLMLIILLISFALMCVGFSFRDRQWGIGALAIGILSVLSTLFYKLYITFN